ncbi:hypothetical protein V1279_007316 [Bradyrhizobium sp. AZCC 1610]|uniref:hypothetical protein n=1 Tax=Bradyrhizobium sp. AZCC 1610 TaxID=3117020 RepID=UPI002FF0FD2B
MKEGLVSQVDSTETLAPEAAGGERLGMAYRAGNGGFVAILFAYPALGCFARRRMLP